MAAVSVPQLGGARRLVVKIGSALLVGPEGLRGDWLRGLCDDVAAWRAQGCDVVLVCHPELVAESLVAVEGRSLNTMALAGLIGRGLLGWDGALAGGASAARTGDTA